jgi:hypothetical protein
VWWNGLKRLSDQEAVSVQNLFCPPPFLVGIKEAMSDERTTAMVRLRDVLDRCQGELERLLAERTRLDERILQLENKVPGVGELPGK